MVLDSTKILQAQLKPSQTPFYDHKAENVYLCSQNFCPVFILFLRQSKKKKPTCLIDGCCSCTVGVELHTVRSHSKLKFNNNIVYFSKQIWENMLQIKKLIFRSNLFWFDYLILHWQSKTVELSEFKLFVETFRIILNNWLCWVFFNCAR